MNSIKGRLIWGWAWLVWCVFWLGETIVAIAIEGPEKRAAEWGHPVLLIVWILLTTFYVWNLAVVYQDRKIKKMLDKLNAN